MTTTVLNTKINEVENKSPNHDKYITRPEFNELLLENFKGRLRQAQLVSKTTFDEKLLSFNRKSTSNKAKYLGIQKKLNSLTKKDYHCFLGRIYLTSNDESQKTFTYQPLIL